MSTKIERLIVKMIQKRKSGMGPGGHGTNARRLCGCFDNLALIVAAGVRRHAAAGRHGGAIRTLG